MSCFENSYDKTEVRTCFRFYKKNWEITVHKIVLGKSFWITFTCFQKFPDKFWNNGSFMMATKGQLISEWHFDVLNFPKKQC